jgi:hypothetical protein
MQLARSLIIVGLAGAAAASAPSLALAQYRDRTDGDSRQQCRVVYDNLPANRQPPPTDCDSARRIAETTRGRLVYIQNGRVQQRRDDDWDRRNDDRWDRDRDRRDRDRRYDDFRRSDYPRRLPLMRWAVGYQQGRYRDDVHDWLHTSSLRVSLRDVRGNRAPEVVTWYDTRGRILQRWIDRDGNGRADRVEIYRANRLYRVID